MPLAAVAAASFVAGSTAAGARLADPGGTSADTPAPLAFAAGDQTVAAAADTSAAGTSAAAGTAAAAAVVGRTCARAVAAAAAAAAGARQPPRPAAAPVSEATAVRLQGLAAARAAPAAAALSHPVHARARRSAQPPCLSGQATRWPWTPGIPGAAQTPLSGTRQSFRPLLP